MTAPVSPNILTKATVATADAVMPAFMFLGFAMVLVGLSFTILGVETHGAPMRLHEQMEGEPVESPAIVR